MSLRFLGIFIILLAVLVSFRSDAAQYKVQINGTFDSSNGSLVITSNQLDNIKGKAGDVLVLTITSPGGASTYAEPILIKVLKLKEAGVHVKVLIPTYAYSWGALMAALVADSIEMSDEAVLLFHYGSLTLGDRGPHNIITLKKTIDRWVLEASTLFNRCCAIPGGNLPILTKDDLDIMSRGFDVVLTKNQVYKRLGLI